METRNYLVNIKKLGLGFNQILLIVSKLTFVLLVLFSINGCTIEKENNAWPEITSQNKPWTRWWWMGNALDKKDITAQLEAFAEVGLGGVEITPIYGTKGYEDKFIKHLTPEWFEMLEHTITEANRLGIGVDMVLGTGWPFGGPQVEPEYAASRLTIQKYQLISGQTFDTIITINDPKQKHLAVLQNVVYFDKNDGKVDLTPMLVDQHLTYTASDDLELYAVFCAKTRQKVKRSAPGGEGYTLDHFSKKAFEDYVLPYQEEFDKKPYALRGIFNDSYEVYGANYSPEFLSEFQKRRKYDLLDNLQILDEKPDSETYKRLLCDYRETIADMLLENFVQTWDQWSNNNNFISKFQAHGSPGNLIDLYAAADIPECEIFGSPHFDIPGYRRDSTKVRLGDNDKLFLKFCSSGAHLQGNEIVSSESFTWLREHFNTALSQCKPVAEDLMLSGVNHMFLHGSTYSPVNEEWPGWKFYASVNFNPTNTIWKDAKYMFEYIARCQSILQEAKTDNDILIYWPIYDAYTNANTKKLLQQYSIHSIDDWMEHTSYYKIANDLDTNGYGFDFISDNFILGAKVEGCEIKVSEGSSYKTIIIPRMHNMPLATLKKLIELKKQGASIIFKGQPETVPGLYDYQCREEQLKQLVHSNMGWMTNTKPIKVQLNELGIYGETASDHGLKILRKKIDGNKIYFVVNHSANTVDDYVSFNVETAAALIMDPLTSKTGLAQVKAEENSTAIKIQLEPGESIFIKTGDFNTETPTWKYIKEIGNAIALINPWAIEFLEGGPTLPQPATMDTLASWTTLGGEYENFSGTAKYSTSFEVDKEVAQGWKLDLGNVRENARVYLNNEFVGAVFANPFIIDISDKIKQGNNELSIEVTNLSANRIRALEQSGKEWKKFYEINMVNIHYKKFDAASWNVAPSGLIDHVQLVPIQFQQ